MQAIRTRTTQRKHAQDDLALMEKLPPPLPSTTQLYGCSFNPELYETHPMAAKNLYDGSSISVLDYIFLEFRKFVSHPHYAKKSVTENFKSDKDFKLPKPSFGPETFEAAKRMVGDFLVPLETYHVCPKDCMIFRGELANKRSCPTCKSERYNNAGRALKVFKYFPLTPRIARIYQSENLVTVLQEHSSRPQG